MKLEVTDRIERPHAGGPVDERGAYVRRSGANAAITRMRPSAQCGQRDRSTCTTRAMNASTDSITVGAGGGRPNSARQVARRAAL